MVLYSENLDTTFPYLMKALDGRLLYDLVEAFMKSKRHKPLRWACLKILGRGAWIKPIREQLLHRPALLKEVIATLQFYTTADPQIKAVNEYIGWSSLAAAKALSNLLHAGGGLTMEELKQFAEMGIVPTLTSWFEANASAHNLQVSERCGRAPGDKTHKQGDEHPGGGPIAAAGTELLQLLEWPTGELACAAYLLGPGISCWNGAKAEPHPGSPTDQQVAVVAALLKPLQGLLNDPRLQAAGLPADAKATRALWYLGGDKEHDLGAYASRLLSGLAALEFEACAPDLPNQLKTDAVAALDLLSGLGVWPDSIISVGGLREGLLGTRKILPWGHILDQRKATDAGIASEVQERKMRELAAQSCSWPGCARSLGADAAGEGGGKEGEEGADAAFQVCARCKIAAYCSKECQAKHWKNGHKICPRNLDVR